MSDHLVSCMEESQFHIPVEHSHTILAQACLGVLLCLDDHIDPSGDMELPLYRYAAEYWFGHAQIGNMELVIKDTLDCFFDVDKPHFSAWVRRELLFELSMDSEDKDTDVLPSATPLYFTAWWGFRGLVE